jgi:hypothetical protein
MLKDSFESSKVRGNGREVTTAEAKSAAESMLSRSCLTKVRRQLKAGAALLIRGVNRWRTD